MNTTSKEAAKNNKGVVIEGITWFPDVIKKEKITEEKFIEIHLGLVTFPTTVKEKGKPAKSDTKLKEKSISKLKSIYKQLV